MTRERAITTLRRRRDWLQARVSVGEGRGEQLHFDRGEIAALSFALAVIEDAEAIGLPRLGRLSVEERARLRAQLEGDEEAA